jgi:peptidoglycan/LPS O-acetylase OafA/YrhL
MKTSIGASPTADRVGWVAAMWAGLRHGAKELYRPGHETMPALDVLRTMAIMLVVTGHYSGDFTAATGDLAKLTAFPIFSFGWTGVDLFFILSGFLIGRQLWVELQQRNTIDVPRFVIKRGYRIWPYYFAFLIWVATTNGAPLADHWVDAVFLSNYLPNRVSGGWSLSTEEQFYILMPVILLLSARFLPRKRWWLVPALLLAALPVSRWIVLASSGEPITGALKQRLTYMPFHTHSDGLLVGVLLAYVFVMSRGFFDKRPLLRNIPVPALMCLTGGALYALSESYFGFTALALFFGALAIFLVRTTGLLARLMALRVFHWISRLSFGMYLNHFPILIAMSPRIAAWTWGTPLQRFVLGYALVVLLSVATAAVTYLLIESPFLQLRERWLRRRKERLAAIPQPS